MDGLGLCRTSIYRWLRTARKDGMSALDARRHRGPSPRVPDAEAEVLRRLVVGHAPRDYRLAGRLWTRASVRALLRRRLSRTLSLPAVGRLLRRAALHPSGGTIPSEALPHRDTRGLLFAVDGRGAFLCVPFAGQGPELSLSEAAAFLAGQVDRRVDLVAIRLP
jgi:transposase